MRLTCQNSLKPEGRVFRGWLVLWLVISALLTPGIIRAEEAASEAEVKAAFIYNSIKFTEWPQTAFANDNAPIRIAVIGDDEFTETLKTLLKDKKGHGRSFEVKKIVNPADAKGVHILYCPSSETKKFAQYYDVVKKSPVLTIGESAQFLDAGGIINLIIEDQLRFEIHPEAAESANLVISSRLMRLAKTVKRGEVKK
jgi:hypothetical protein